MNHLYEIYDVRGKGGPFRKRAGDLRVTPETATQRNTSPVDSW